MAEDPLRDIVDGVRARLQDELETQLRAVSERHQQALAEARRHTEREAEEQCARRVESAKGELDAARAELGAVRAELDGARAELDAARAELDTARAELDTVKAKLESAKAEREAVRAESEEHLHRAVAAARAEVQQQAAEERERARVQVEQALARERQLAESELEAERRRAAEDLERARETFEAERARATADAAATGQAGSLTEQADSLVRGFRAIDAARSVADSLAAIARAAAAEAPRATLFVANGSQLEEWEVSGVASLSAGSLNVNDPDSGIAVEALTTRKAVRSNGSACAVPLVLDGTPVGVLYGEADANTNGTTPWSDSLEALATYGAAHLGYLTALRTAQARQWLASADSTRGGSAAADEETIASARRYARLVVSEIKLYNEAAVQIGRSRRDLRQRLEPEIERARCLYEERVPASVAGRSDYFQQELVQILAGGDPSLLG